LKIVLQLCPGEARACRVTGRGTALQFPVCAGKMTDGSPM